MTQIRSRCQLSSIPLTPTAPKRILYQCEACLFLYFSKDNVCQSWLPFLGLGLAGLVFVIVLVVFGRGWYRDYVKSDLAQRRRYRRLRSRTKDLHGEHLELGLTQEKMKQIQRIFQMCRASVAARCSEKSCIG